MTHLVDFMIIMPLGPQLLRALGMPPTALGQLVFAYTLSAGLTGLALGATIHRFSRRTLLLAVYAGFALALVATFTAGGFAGLLLARVVAGACGGVLSSLVHATVADHVVPERRAAALGKVMTGHALASVIGVPLGLGIASALGWRAPFALLLILVLPLWHVASRCVPRATEALPAAASGPVTGLRGLLAWSPAFALTFAVSASAYALVAYFAPYWLGTVGVGEAGLPFVFLAAGALSLYTSPRLGRLADRHGRLKVFICATLVSVPTIALASRSGPLPTWIAVALGATFLVTLYGRWIPALALLSEWPPHSLRGGFMMTNGVVTQLSMGVGAMLAGRMISIDAAGRLEGFGQVGDAAIVVSLCAILIAWRLARHIAQR
ncbi:MAG: MFS transporter [Proteobacteria bacterium]|nr:MFS transporter [Pseudomonadota bacterium]